MNNAVRVDGMGESVRQASGFADGVRHGITRMFYGMLGGIGVLLWLVMQLPLGARARNALLTVMAACFGVFALGWRLLSQQSAGRRG